jgi:peptidoglycan/xylan/chitin deacetylase (PgdA/CDA1 family)
MELVAREYSPVSLEEILLFIQGQKQLPKNAVAVTFDDGYRENFEIADRVLRDYGIPAAFYLTASWIGTNEVPWFCRLRHAFATTRRNEWSDPVRGLSWKLSDPMIRNAALQAAFDMGSSMNGDVCRATVRTIEHELDVAPLALRKDLMMSWDQARKLHDAGHIVGSHTMTHPNVAHLSDEEIVRKELIESKRRVEVELDAPVEHFSYPHPALNPQWTQRTMEITREAGYQTAVTTTAGPIRVGNNPLQLTRVIVPRLEGQFRWALESAFLGRAT